MWLNLAVKIATASTEDELDYRHPGKIISMSFHTKKTGGAAGAPPPNVWCLLVSFHFTHEPNTSRDDFCQAFWPPKRHVAAKWSGSEVICIVLIIQIPCAQCSSILHPFTISHFRKISTYEACGNGWTSLKEKSSPGFFRPARLR